MGAHATYYIYRDGKAYDNMFAANQADLPFWLEQACVYGDPILELGCGTGRVSIPLAKQGYAVTGIDLAEAMLSEARKKRQSSRPKWNGKGPTCGTLILAKPIP